MFSPIAIFASILLVMFLTGYLLADWLEDNKINKPKRVKRPRKKKK